MSAHPPLRVSNNSRSGPGPPHLDRQNETDRGLKPCPSSPALGTRAKPRGANLRRPAPKWAPVVPTPIVSTLPLQATLRYRDANRIRGQSFEPAFGSEYSLAAEKR